MKGVCVCGSLQVLTSKATFREWGGHSRSSCTLGPSSLPLWLGNAWHMHRVPSDWHVKNPSSTNGLKSMMLLWAMKKRCVLHLVNIFRGKIGDFQLTEGMKRSDHMVAQSVLARTGFPTPPCDVTVPSVSRREIWMRKRVRRQRILSPDHCSGPVTAPEQIYTSPESSPEDTLRTQPLPSAEGGPGQSVCLSGRIEGSLRPAGRGPPGRLLGCSGRRPTMPTGSGWAVPLRGLWGGAGGWRRAHSLIQEDLSQSSSSKGEEGEAAETHPPTPRLLKDCSTGFLFMDPL